MGTEERSRANIQSGRRWPRSDIPEAKRMEWVSGRIERWTPWIFSSGSSFSRPPYLGKQECSPSSRTCQRPAVIPKPFVFIPHDHWIITSCWFCPLNILESVFSLPPPWPPQSHYRGLLPALFQNSEVVSLLLLSATPVHSPHNRQSESFNNPTYSHHSLA